MVRQLQGYHKGDDVDRTRFNKGVLLVDETVKPPGVSAVEATTVPGPRSGATFSGNVPERGRQCTPPSSLVVHS